MGKQILLRSRRASIATIISEQASLSSIETQLNIYQKFNLYLFMRGSNTNPRLEHLQITTEGEDEDD